MSEPTPARRRSARWIGGALVLGALVAAPLAIAGAHGMRGPHGGCHEPPQSAEEIRDHMGDMADRALDRVDATDAQRDTVDTALDDMAPKLWSLHDRHEALREDFGAAFGAEKLDRAALEDVRKDALALADEASGYVVDAVFRVGSVLSAEQRRQVLDDVEAMHR